MSFKKKFKISKLDKKLRLEESVYIVLGDRLNQIIKQIDRYFKEDSTENLHEMRISFRKFRYVFEIFYDCLPPKLFKHVYTIAKDMQDLIGTARDLDVLEMKIKLTAEEINQQVPEYFFEKIENEKIIAKQNIKMELIKFISDKEINKLLV
jgi:CHAD domain-containing protein